MDAAAPGPTEEILQSFAEEVRTILRADTAFLYLSDMGDGETCGLAAESHAEGEVISAGPVIQLTSHLESVWRDESPLRAAGSNLPFLPRPETDTWTIFRVGSKSMPFGLLFVLRADGIPNHTHELNRVSKLLECSLPKLHEAWVRWLVRRRSETLRSLLDISTSLASSLDRETVLGKVVQETAVLLSAKLCSLMLLDPEGQELVLEAAYGCSLEYLEKPNLPVSDSLLGRVVSGGEVIRVRDVRTDPQYLHRDLARREGLCSLLTAPVQFADKVLGVLSIYSAMPHEWTEEDEDLLRALASSAAVAIQNASLVDRIAEIEQKASRASRLSALGELTASLAHQIRNPLAVVNMLIHSWTTSALPGQIQDDLRVITENVNVLNRIVEGALSLARQQPTRPRDFDLSEIVDGLLLLLRHQVGERRVRFVNEVQPDFPPIFADSDQVEQALLNLIVNAIEALPVDGEIAVRAWKIQGGTAIEVQDNGPGINPEIRESLFEAFTTTKPGGLGLGLSVVNRIVRDHGGKVVVSDRAEGGTSFILEFPGQGGQTG